MGNKLNYHVKEALDSGLDIIVAKIVNTDGSTPRHEGTIMALDEKGNFYGTIGGGKIEAVTREECERLMQTRELMEADDRSKIEEYRLNIEDKDALGMACGGDANIMFTHVSSDEPERFEDKSVTKTVYIFGAGHVGLALEPVLRSLDFETVVIDDRKEFACRERFPDATRVKVIGSFKESFDDIVTDEHSYIVIVTRGHSGDLDVLRDALKQKFAYLGMIGSRVKNKTLYDILLAEGVTQEELDRVHAPIGTQIFAETPEEIAISIAAEIIITGAGHDEARKNI